MQGSTTLGNGGDGKKKSANCILNGFNAGTGKGTQSFLLLVAPGDDERLLKGLYLGALTEVPVGTAISGETKTAILSTEHRAKRGKINKTRMDRIVEKWEGRVGVWTPLVLGHTQGKEPGKTRGKIWV